MIRAPRAADGAADDRAAAPARPAEGSSRPAEGPARPWALVAQREMVTKLTDRSFLIGTVLTVAVLVAFMAAVSLLGERTQTNAVAVTPAAVAMGEDLRRAAPAIDSQQRVELLRVADDAAARAALRDGTADAWLHPTAAGWELSAQADVPEGLAAVTTQAVQQKVLADNAAGVGASVASLTRGSAVTTSVLDGDARQKDFAKAMSFAMAFLFYLASVMFGIALAGSVVEEKSSRIVEIIATKIPVRHLLAGKVVGNTALALGQMALYTGLGLIGLSFTSYSSFLPSVSVALVWFAAFFVVGFLLIACLWAVAGALASRTEDLQSTSTPLTMLMMGIFFAALLLRGTALTIASYVPPLSAVLMPLRVIEGQASWWEPVVAIVLLLAAAGFVVLGAERVYRRSLLQTQGRISVRQAWNTPD